MGDVDTRSLSIVVPAYNEEGRLPSLLDELGRRGETIAQTAGSTLLEVVIVDDGSTDATPSLLESATTWPSIVEVIRLDKHRGKGAAVRAGILAARGERILVTDVDLSTPLDELGLLAAALDDGAGVAIGSRSISGSRVIVHQPRHRELMGKTFNLLLRLLTGVPWRDTQCGFKLFRTDVARRLCELQRIEGFAYDAELCVNALRLGADVVEVPVRWLDNDDTRVRLVRSSTEMARDLVRIAWMAHRPLPGHRP